MRHQILFVFLLNLSLGFFTHAESSPDNDNLFENPGFEEVKDVDLTSGYFARAIRDFKIDLGEDIVAKIPTNFDQFSGTKKFIMVEGAPGKEVHGGKYALKVDGGFYTRCTFPVQEGESYHVSYYVKGISKTGVVFNLPGPNGVSIGSAVPKVYPVEVNSPNEWVEVEHTIRIPATDPPAKTATVRFDCTGEATIDDVVIRKQ